MYNQRRQSIPKSLSPRIKTQSPIIIEEKIKGQNNQTKNREYIRGRLLGKGGFAKCYELICKDNNKIFAAKMIQKNNLKSERQKQKLIF